MAQRKYASQIDIARQRFITDPRYTIRKLAEELRVPVNVLYYHSKRERWKEKRWEEAEKRFEETRRKLEKKRGERDKEDWAAFLRSFCGYLRPRDPLAKRIVETVDALQTEAWRSERERECADVAIEALWHLLEAAYPNVVERAELYAELEELARQRAQEEGLSIGVAKAQILFENRELYQKLLHHV